ncbi:DNA-binding protein [Streptococcus respiraculi]|uniref:DNA-binding protein n=1 Tax=Streptococcus respiraculi TaxID=2021971 RepID=UPI000E7100CF|nr:DNA-binding protein [Streptococcus respiraculi]
MNELMNQLLDQFEAGLMERYLRVMKRIGDEKDQYPLELTKAKCSKMLLGTEDTTTFDMRFNSRADFPKIKGKREKFPRDAVIEWYRKNWMNTGV